MRKLFNNRFLFILASSLVVLIVLGIGAFYLFDDSDDTFVKSGYVLNPLSSTVEKYFFDENVSYKENLSSMIEFKDVDSNEVSVLKDSFLHYMDDSLSFLKNGAILDLNSIKGNSAVRFYNITNKSIIEKTEDGYLIKTNGSDIEFKNFIGRINDNKYIVVGDLSAKIVGNSTNISGEYFEIVYVEEGVVNIENKNVKYQVAADGTIIYVGNDIKIDLGDKKIVKADEDVMSITAITIDGDENIEIIPQAPEEDTDASGGGGGGSGSGDGTGTGDGDGNGEGDGTGEGGDGSGEGGTDNPNVEVDKINDIVITLKDADVGSTSIDVTFDIVNAEEDDVFMLKVTNLDTGRTVDMEPIQVVSDEKIMINLISPKTKYLFTVYDSEEGNKYFQKIFETTDFGIKLERSYATDSAIAYKVIVDEGTELTNAKLSLYRYDEGLMDLVPVTTSYYDAEKEETIIVDKVKELAKNEDGSVEGIHEIVFDGLDNNTIYTAVLDDFSLASSNFKDLYNLTLTGMTLKKTPVFSDMTYTKDVGEGSFTLTIGNVVDPDKAITNYSYEIYEVGKEDEPVVEIFKNNASPIEVLIGNEEGQLKNDVNYFYRVIIEYFDNEKYIEYTNEDRVNFVMGSEPYITVVRNDDNIGYDKIGATIYLTDNSCLIPVPGRGENCLGNSNPTVVVCEVNSATGELKDNCISKPIEFDVKDRDIKYELKLDGLKENTTYQIDVMAEYSDDLVSGPKSILHTDGDNKRITTKTLASFIMGWTPKNSSSEHVVNIQAQFLPEDGTGTLSPDETASSIKKVVIELYEGAHEENFYLAGDPIKTATFYDTDIFNIKENFYDNGYNITTDGTFGLDIDGLKALNAEGKLNEYYTIAVYAYFDEVGINPVRLGENYVCEYQISELLLLENVIDPIIKANEIKNTDELVHPILNELSYKSVDVGYTIEGLVDAVGLRESNLVPKKVKWYVYNNKKELVQFYVKGEDGELVLMDSLEEELSEDWSGNVTTEIFMGYGTEYFEIDSVMSRGGEYYIGYVIDVETTDGEILSYPTLKDVEDSPNDFGIYEKKLSQKVSPKLGMYVASSTKDSITYRYDIKDPDNALYRETADGNYGFYYTIDNGSENKLDIIDTTNGTTYSTYAGDITISGLKNGTIYSLYYKKNISKTGVFEDDVKPYLDEEDDGGRLFDGFYDDTESKYNFRYEVINNPLVDNKVYIKILAVPEMLDRILSYRVTFKDLRGNEYFTEIYDYELSACPGEVVPEEGSEEAASFIGRCFSVDYKILNEHGMKSNQVVENTITIDIEAGYDNGLTGFDLELSATTYQYMIFQANNTASGRGNYYAFSKDNKLNPWNKDLAVPKGYYTYSLSGNLLGVENREGKYQPLTVALTSLGYSFDKGIINPKMITISKMRCDNNKFSFSSITPKIDVVEKSQMINGAVFNLTLSGADLNDFVYEKDVEEPGYYLYIDTYSSGTISTGTVDTVRPTLKVKINENNSSASLRAVIDLLNPGREYYFNVYAYMYKNGESVYTQLFDNGYTDRYEEKSYTFKTLGYSDMYRDYKYTFSVNSEKEYGSRDLTLTTNLNPYKNGEDYNFDFGYAIYEYAVNCTPRMIEEGTCSEPYVIKGNIGSKDLTSNIVHVSDISDSVLDPDFEFNRSYTTFIYAIYDTYDTITKKVEKGYLVFNNYDRTFTPVDKFDSEIKKLIEPEFTVTREAIILEDAKENGEDDYAINLGITVNDRHQTIINGKYFIKLMDENENVVGELQVIDEDGNYKTISNYDTYEFDAATLYTQVRIIGLDADTKYTISVYSNAYINNFSNYTIPEERVVFVHKTHNVYTANDYGIAFGDLDYGLTENSLVVTFLGGSSFKNVAMIDYTVQLYENNESVSTISGEYMLDSESGKTFELNTETGNFRFVIDPKDMKNVEGQTYLITTRYSVIDGNDEEGNPIYKTIYSHTDRRTYVKEQINK